MSMMMSAILVEGIRIGGTSRVTTVETTPLSYLPSLRTNVRLETMAGAEAWTRLPTETVLPTKAGVAVTLNVEILAAETSSRNASRTRTRNVGATTGIQTRFEVATTVEVRLIQTAR